MLCTKSFAKEFKISDFNTKAFKIEDFKKSLQCKVKLCKVEERILKAKQSIFTSALQRRRNRKAYGRNDVFSAFKIEGFNICFAKKRR